MMFSVALIVFRESLEAALFIGIVAASTHGLKGRASWLTLGVLAGLCGSMALAAGMGPLSELANGIGPDLLNAAMLGIALLMLAWHCIWVSPKAADRVADARQLSQSAVQGQRSLWALAIAVALAVLREGAETVLFVSGVLSNQPNGRLGLLLGVGSGLAAGALLGLLIYSGLTGIATRKLFALTHFLMLLLAGNLASQLAKTLSQAGLVTWGATPVWNQTSLLSNDSAAGLVLHALLGYEAQPTGLQLGFYLASIGLIALAAQRMKQHP